MKIRALVWLPEIIEEKLEVKRKVMVEEGKAVRYGENTRF